MIRFLEDLERRIRTSGGAPVQISGEQMHIICYMRNGEFTGDGPIAIGRRHLVTISKLKERVRQAITEHVAFTLTPVPWIKGNGFSIAVTEMEPRHIRNTINMIKEGRLRREGCNGLTNYQWVRVFENELLVRVCNERP